MENNNKQFYLGLDIGTSSVGWAVTDTNYKLIKKKGKNLWGVRLFEEGKSAADRRVFRTNRRRLERQKQRVQWLQEIFGPEIEKVDPEFFIRLNNSAFWLEDKEIDSKYSLFSDETYCDIQHFKKYPTIYHLQKELIDNKKPAYDIRLVYLALHHLVKHRGHFLLENMTLSTNGKEEYGVKLFQEIDDILSELNDDISTFFSEKVSYQILSILADKANRGSTRKIEKFKELFPESDKTHVAIFKLLSGGTEKIANILHDVQLDELEKPSICFGDSKFEEEVLSVLEETLGDSFSLIEKLYTLYGYILYKNVIGENAFLCEAKIKQYHKHHQELAELKQFFKKYYPSFYNAMFRQFAEDNNFKLANAPFCPYTNYIGSTKVRNNKRNFSINNKKRGKAEKCDHAIFLKSLKGFLTKTTPMNEDDAFIEHKNKIMELIDQGDYLKKLSMKDNASIPYQVNYVEMEKILDNASNYLPFLKDVTSDDLSNRDKILQIMKYRIPYYVGPLNDAHSNLQNAFAWVVRKEKGAVNPYNFQQKIDEASSQQRFIRRMTNKCTYLYGQDVLPASSLLYCEYDLLNKLNVLKLNGELINQELKSRLINELFKKRKSVKIKDIATYLKQQGIKGECTFSELDLENVVFPKSNYVDFYAILGSDVEKNINIIETIIVWLSIFTNSNTIEELIYNNFANYFSDKQIKQLSRVKLVNPKWGRLSREFLNGPHFVLTTRQGEVKTIIEIMRETNLNFMQILNTEEYDALNAIENFNNLARGQVTSIEDVIDEEIANSYVSPAVKRSYYQAMKVVDEITHVLGKSPKRIFVEVTRASDEKKKGKKTSSRHAQLQSLYKEALKTIPEIKSLSGELDVAIDDKLQSDRLFLYFLQLGKCMYTGKPIDIQRIMTKDYDIDHIYPQSFVKDDSFDNRVLITKDANMKKGNIFPVHKDIQKEMKDYWEMLSNSKFISKEKKDRLTRTLPFTDDERKTFINRQLVTTAQSVLLVINILKKKFGSNTEVVYSKAKNVSEFRQKFDFYKVRDINDLHHAKDAYLNIVVGNAYHEKYTANHSYYYGDKQSNQLSSMFEIDIKNAWNTENSTSIKLVRKIMGQNDILVSRKVKQINNGGLFDQQLVSYHNESSNLAPIKEKGPLSNTKHYGGFNSISIAYFAVFASKDKKGKPIVSIESIPTLLLNKIKRKEIDLQYIAEDYFNLREPQLVYAPIYPGNKLKIENGFYYISGKTSNSYALTNATQLILPLYLEKYVGTMIKINKIYESFSKEKKAEILDDLTISDWKLSKNENSHDNRTISKEGNLLLLNIIEEKMTMNKFNLLRTKKYIENIKEFFTKLSLIRQVKVLLAIIDTIVCAPNSVKFNDLFPNDEEYKKAKIIVGRIMVGKNITKSNISLIHESSTGLFQQEIVINKKDN